MLKMITNSYSANRETSRPRQKIPKLLIYIFLSFNFLFGLDFGFTEWIQNKKFRFSVKLVKNVSAIACVSMLGIYVIDGQHSYSLWIVLNLSHYLMCFFVLSVTKYNFYDFSKDLYSVFNNCILARKDRVVTVFVMCLFVGVAVKIIVFIAECVYDGTFGEVLLYLYILPCISVDVIPLVLITTYYYINNFVTCLNEAYFRSEISLNYLENNYIAIMDCFDKIKPFYGNLVSIYCICIQIHI